MQEEALMFDTKETKKDKLGRQRTVKQAKKVPLLVAQGDDGRGSGAGAWAGHAELGQWPAGRAQAVAILA